MAIGSEQRDFLTRRLRAAIAQYYGEDVPTLDIYLKRRRG